VAGGRSPGKNAALVVPRQPATGIRSFAGPANEASRGILLKLGFRRERDEPYPPTSLMHPSFILMASGQVEKSRTPE
jgi:hypothetical protein